MAIYDPLEDERLTKSPSFIGPRRSGWRHTWYVVPPELMALFAPRMQYVGQLEVLAAVVPYSSRPEQLRGRDVIHFIDNTGALYGMANGYSGDDDSARLIHAYHCILGAVDANVWLEYVPSGANIADHPSRSDFALLREWGSRYFEAVLPPLGGDWYGLYRRYFDALAPPLPKAERKRRRELDDAIASARASARGS